MKPALCPLLLPLLPLLAPAALAQADFTSAWLADDVTIYPNGVWPAATAEADLDGDGRSDLVSVSWESETQPRMALLYGDGEGGFDAPLVHVLIEPSRGVRPADLDGDGDLDLAVSGTGKHFDGDFVEIWQNQGQRAFVRSGTFGTGAFGAPVGLDAADVDQDGDLDLAVAIDRYIISQNRVALLFNDGSGAFSAPTTLTTPGSTFLLEAADLNADGRPDLVAGGEAHEATVLLNTGIGFAPGVKYVLSLQESFDEWPALELDDVDGDGDLDLLGSAIFAGTGAFEGDTGLVGLRRNSGSGAFGPLELIELLPGFEGAVDLELADVTGDGHDDLLAAIAWNDLWAVLPGNGTGSFGPAALHRIGDGPHGIHAIDVDQDGDQDVALLERGAMAVATVENLGAGLFPVLPAHDLVPPSYNPASYSPSVSADFDGDGDLDALVGFSANFLGPLGLSLARNQGDGTFAPSQITPTGVFPFLVAAGDLDQDGDVDLAYADDDFTPALRWRLNSGTGVFGAEKVGPTIGFCDFTQLVLADVDADLDLDAVAGGCYGAVKVSKWNAATATFSPVATHNVSGSTTALALGDLNGDGKLDLVTNSAVQDYPEISLGTGAGTFQPPFAQPGGFGVAAIAIADLDRDGILDLATHDQLGESMTVQLGLGNGTFQPAVKHPAVYDDARAILAVDVDGDLDLDLVAPNPGAMDVSLWRNDGAGVFAPQVRLGVGHPVTDLEPGDFDGDGVLDLLALVEPNLIDWYYPGLVTLRGLAAEAWTDLGFGLAGAGGIPHLTGLGLLDGGSSIALHLAHAAQGAPGVFVIGAQPLMLPFAGGTLVPSLTVVAPTVTDAAGAAVLTATFPPGLPSGATFWFQAGVLDPAAVQGLAASNALKATVP